MKKLRSIKRFVLFRLHDSLTTSSSLLRRFFSRNSDFWWFETCKERIANTSWTVFSRLGLRYLYRLLFRILTIRSASWFSYACRESGKAELLLAVAVVSTAGGVESISIPPNPGNLELTGKLQVWFAR